MKALVINCSPVKNGATAEIVHVACTDVRNTYRVPMAVGLVLIILLTTVMMNTIAAAEEEYRKLTYSVYPYLPDVNYYAEVLEEEWEKQHPDIRLEYVPYDCYFGGKPEGIDVIMYDVIMERAFIEKGYIRPLDISDCIDAEDFYAFTLEPAAGYADNYGVHVFLCCDLLIYDKDNKGLSEADDIFDVAASDSKALISFASYGDHVYTIFRPLIQTTMTRRAPASTFFLHLIKNVHDFTGPGLSVSAQPVLVKGRGFRVGAYYFLIVNIHCRCILVIHEGFQGLLCVRARGSFPRHACHDTCNTDMIMLEVIPQILR